MIDQSRRGLTAGMGTLALTATALLGMAVTVAMWLLVHDGGEPSVDRDAFSALQTSSHTFIGGHAQDLATLATVLAVVLAAATLGLLAWRRCWHQAIALAFGYPLMLAVGYALKALVARQRPPAPVLLAAGYSFPSTDAAVSVGIVVGALALARLTGDRRLQAGLVAASLVAALAVGVLMIALRVHYLTDIIAGYGLGVSGLAIAALGTRLIARYRSSTRVSLASRRSH